MNSREDIERLVDEGSTQFVYKGQTVTIEDDDKGWSYHWNGTVTRNLDTTLDAIEAVPPLVQLAKVGE